MPALDRAILLLGNPVECSRGHMLTVSAGSWSHHYHFSAPQMWEAGALLLVVYPDGVVSPISFDLAFLLMCQTSTNQVDTEQGNDTCQHTPTSDTTHTPFLVVTGEIVFTEYPCHVY